jgi:hypothetical protein
MVLTAHEAFQRLEISHARLLALKFELSCPGERPDVILDLQADLLQEITDDLADAWGALLLEGRAISTMRASLAAFGPMGRADE